MTPEVIAAISSFFIGIPFGLFFAVLLLIASTSKKD